MRFGSLYAGVGGFDIGLEAAGMECAWQVEIDEYASRVLEKHWPDVRRWDDIKTFPPDPVEDWSVDMVVGGPPCPPVSVAGERKGDSDERWLWPEMRRVCEAIGRPPWLLLENVGGLLSAGDVRGSLFGGILRDLAQIGYGHIEWHSISAAHCGSPQVRSRIWLLAYAPGVGQPRPWQPLDASDPTPIITREAIDALDGRFRHQWGVESRIRRVADGVPSRVHRLRCLGNAVLPQLVEFIACRIMEVERGDVEDSAAVATEGTLAQRQGSLGSQGEDE